MVDPLQVRLIFAPPLLYNQDGLSANPAENIGDILNHPFLVGVLRQWRIETHRQTTE
jgi:hypothetical protein